MLNPSSNVGKYTTHEDGNMVYWFPTLMKDQQQEEVDDVQL